jgi:hypothetical protein
LGTHTKKDEGESRETGNIGHARKRIFQIIMLRVCFPYRVKLQGEDTFPKVWKIAAFVCPAIV